jgi:hypothetical protein
MKLEMFLVLALAASSSSAQQAPPETQTVTLAAGVPLHIKTTRTVALRTGATVEGVLTEPIYVHDRLVLPKGVTARGTVIAYAPVARKIRAEALLNGDVTPLHLPVVNFNSLHGDAWSGRRQLPFPRACSRHATGALRRGKEAAVAVSAGEDDGPRAHQVHLR